MQSEQKKCPIPGCNMHYSQGITGWARHVGSLDIHPFWRPDLPNAAERRHSFVQEFPHFFIGARSRVSSRPPIPPPPSSSQPLSPALSAEMLAAIRLVIREVVREELAMAFNAPLPAPAPLPPQTLIKGKG